MGSWKVQSRDKLTSEGIVLVAVKLIKQFTIVVNVS